MAFTDATTTQSEIDWLSAMRSKTSSMRSETLSRQRQTESLLKQACELRQQNNELSRRNNEFFNSLLDSCPPPGRGELAAAASKEKSLQAEAGTSQAPPSLLLPKRGRLQQPRYGQLREMTAD